VSFVPRRFEDGDLTGVPRFDWELRRVFPRMVSETARPRARAWLKWLALRHPDTIVITGNDMSMLVPRRLRTIVVHHGCAQTHFDRDPDWRGAEPQRLCAGQRQMYRRENRWYIALARWCADQFSEHYRVPTARLIPSWVEPIDRRRHAPARPVVLGDFRTFNKGRDTLARLTQALPKWEFRTLSCTYETRKAAYAAADAYLCLSLSEGGSFAMSDAEAADLPLVTTDVGNYREYSEAAVIPWQARDDVAQVQHALDRALNSRRGPSFFANWTFDSWRRTWLDLVDEVAASAHREPLLP
jgi:glycosyltransferase involved in cell wall biosynthesis